MALGHYGEVVLLDWGLARLEGKEDVASSAWQERVEEMRHDADFHTMEGGAMGTAGYMSPEATLGGSRRWTSEATSTAWGRCSSRS